MPEFLSPGKKHPTSSFGKRLLLMSNMTLTSHWTICNCGEIMKLSSVDSKASRHPLTVENRGADGDDWPSKGVL